MSQPAPAGGDNLNFSLQYLVLVPLQWAYGVCLVLWDSLGEDSGHDQDNGHAQDVARVGVQVNDLHVVIIAVPKQSKKPDHFSK